MEHRRKHKPDASLFYTLSDNFGAGINLYTKFGKYVRRTAFTGNRTITMLCYIYPRPGSDQCRSSRHIEGLDRCAAGSYDIY